MKREHGRQVAGSAPGAPDVERAGGVSVTATEAKNEFGRMLDIAAVRDRCVFITRHNKPRAVLMSIDRFDALARTDEGMLETLGDEFDTLLKRMQSADSRAAMRQAFHASPEALGRAAVVAVERRDDG